MPIRQQLASGSVLPHRSAGRNANGPISARVLCGLLLPVDLAALGLAAAIAYAIRFSGPFADDATIIASPSAYLALAAFGSLLAVNVFHVAGLYATDIVKLPGRTTRRLALCWIGVASALAIAGYLTKSSEDFSRLWSLLWFGIGLTALLGLRWAFFTRVTRWLADGRLDHKIAIIGSGPLAERVAAHFVTRPHSGIRVVGLFADEDRAAVSDNPARRRAGSLHELIGRIRTQQVDTVLVAMPDADQRRITEILGRLGEAPVDVRLCPGPEAFYLLGRNVSHYAGLPTLNVADRPLTDWRYTVKEIEDRLIGVSIALLILPVLFVIGIAVRLDSPGPALFRQKRYGFNNELIEIFKFRTMFVDKADARAEKLTERDDPRITRIGRFLRAWSLDELPQFLNVVRGEMSIVGPRPHAIAPKAGGRLYHDAVPSYYARHRVKPGITGWAQINGWRGPTDTVLQLEKRVEHDLYYIDNWSLWLDLKILFLTIFKGFRSDNAF